MLRHTTTLTALSALLLLSGSPAWAELGALPFTDATPLAAETAEDHLYMPDDMNLGEPVADHWQDVEPIYDI